MPTKRLTYGNIMKNREPEKISHNPTQRSINKLLLNSLWGKFSVRADLAQTTFVKDHYVFTSIVFGKTDTLKFFTFVSDDVELVQCPPPPIFDRLVTLTCL